MALSKQAVKPGLSVNSLLLKHFFACGIQGKYKNIFYKNSCVLQKHLQKSFIGSNWRLQEYVIYTTAATDFFNYMTEVFPSKTMPKI